MVMLRCGRWRQTFRTRVRPSRCLALVVGVAPLTDLSEYVPRAGYDSDRPPASEHIPRGGQAGDDTLVLGPPVRRRLTLETWTMTPSAQNDLAVG